ncbi:cysteine peptidase family C39 domain-containing protein [Planctomycetota bacterium]
MQLKKITIIVIIFICTEYSFSHEYDLSSNLEYNMMCGPNCLFQVACIFGRYHTLGSISNMAEFNVHKGVSFANMIKAAEKMGLYAKAYKTNVKTIQDIDKAKYVIILPLNIDDYHHFTLLDSISDSVVGILDSDKYCKIKLNEMKKIWDGYLIVISDDMINIEANKTLSVNIFFKYIGIAFVIVGLILMKNKLKKYQLFRR